MTTLITAAKETIISPQSQKPMNTMYSVISAGLDMRHFGSSKPCGDSRLFFLFFFIVFFFLCHLPKGSVCVSLSSV